MQNVLCSACAAIARLAELNKLDLCYPSVLAKFAIAQTRDGRMSGSRLLEPGQQPLQAGADRVDVPCGDLYFGHWGRFCFPGLQLSRHVAQPLARATSGTRHPDSTSRWNAEKQPKTRQVQVEGPS